MKKKLAVLLANLLICTIVFSQSKVDVTEQTLKLGAQKTAELFFSFAEGDQILFNFAEADKKEVEEVAIIEYPANTRFSASKVDRIKNKTLTVSKTAIYTFRFHNSAPTDRVCKIRLQRIPATEATKQYNTSVNWMTKHDTVWNAYTREVIVGYDTTYEQTTRKELVKTEQKEVLVLDRSQWVHSLTNSYGNKTAVSFTLPPPQTGNNKTASVIAWAYWVGVNDAAAEAWQQNVQAVRQLAAGKAGSYTTPLGALAVGAVAELVVPKVGEDVFYAITNEANKELFLAGKRFRLMDQGKGIAGYKKFTDKALCQGTYDVCLSNDNTLIPVTAHIKVVAIVETNYYADKVSTEKKVTPRYEKQGVKEPIIKTTAVPVADGVVAGLL